VIGAHALLKILMYYKYIPVFALLFTPLTPARYRSETGSKR
jgi:hypothetical protein